MFHPKRESYFALYRILGYFPHNLSYYEEALRHKSSSKERINGRYLNNERLEFLGDAILDAVVADIVYKEFPTRNEGFLTNTRSKIVKRESLDRISSELGLHKLIISSSRARNQKSHILGNALEAFIGAIYLDQGYRKTNAFIREKIIRPYIDLEATAKKEVNFKSKLIEWSQKYKIDLEFVILESFTDSNSNLLFQSQALLQGMVAGIGTGYSKKESQQEAAQMAMKKLKSDKAFVAELQRLKEAEELISNTSETEETELTTPDCEHSSAPIVS